jgi:hypothetical protein
MKSFRTLISADQCRLVVYLLLISNLHAAQPSWWSTGDTAFIDDSPGQDHSTSANYAPANLGQLKNVAKMAKFHLDVYLPGGAGSTIDTLVTSFNVTDPDNYAPISLGQLKAVARPFYDRLIAAGYNTQMSLQNHGFTSAGFYPWNSSTPVNDNYAPANLGQLKMAFSFDASDPSFYVVPDAWQLQYFGSTGHASTADDDGDGLSNLQEYVNGTNPNDFFNGIPATLTITWGNNQTGAPGSFVSQPLTVKITNTAGRPYTGGSVTYTVTSGGGTLQPTSTASPATTQTRVTESTGETRMHFKLPATANTTCTVTATFAGQTRSFTETTGSATMETTESPFGPLNVRSQLNDDGSVDLTWDQNPDDNSPVPIWVKNDNDVWVKIDTARAGTTSYHIPAQ